MESLGPDGRWERGHKEAVWHTSDTVTEVECAASSRTLREEVYRAYITRGAVGDSNNGPIIESILALRHEQAQLIGFPNFVEYSMASKVPLRTPLM